MIIKWILCCLLSYLAFAPEVSNANKPDHALKISLCKITYEKNSHVLSIKFIIFRDDLKTALKQEGLGGLNLSTISTYIRSHFSLTFDGNPQELSQGKLEQTSQTSVLTFVLTDINLENFKDIGIENTLLLKQFKKQKNLIHLELRTGEKQMWVFKSGYTREIMKF